MTRKEMYNKLMTIPGYAVVRRYPDGSKNYYFYEIFKGDSHKDTLYRLMSHGIDFNRDLVLEYNDFFNVIFMIDNVYRVSDEYAEKYELWHKDRITKTVFDAPINYAGARTLDIALSY